MPSQGLDRCPPTTPLSPRSYETSTAIGANLIPPNVTGRPISGGTAPNTIESIWTWPSSTCTSVRYGIPDTLPPSVPRRYRMVSISANEGQMRRLDVGRRNAGAPGLVWVVRLDEPSEQRRAPLIVKGRGRLRLHSPFPCASLSR